MRHEVPRKSSPQMAAEQSRVGGAAEQSPARRAGTLGAPAPGQPLGQSPRTQKHQRREGRPGTVGAPEARSEARGARPPIRRTGAKNNGRKAYVFIDYPREGETIALHDYTFRLGVGNAENVEVSVNGGLWQRCRSSVGYWWFDWRGYPGGRHTVQARMRTKRGAVRKSAPRVFEAAY